MAFLDGKQLLISNQVIRKSIELKIGYFNEKQLLISNTVFRRSIELELGYFRRKTAVYMKFGVFRNFLFFGAKSWFLFKKSKMATFSKRYSYSKKRLILYEEYNQNHFKAYFEEK